MRLRRGGVFAGTDSRPSLRWRLIYLGDICTPVDPGTLPGRLAAAGFTGIAVDADKRLVRFAAYTPGAEGEARPGTAEAAAGATRSHRPRNANAAHG